MKVYVVQWIYREFNEYSGRHDGEEIRSEVVGYNAYVHRELAEQRCIEEERKTVVNTLLDEMLYSYFDDSDHNILNKWCKELNLIDPDTTDNLDEYELASAFQEKEITEEDLVKLYEKLSFSFAEVVELDIDEDIVP